MLVPPSKARIITAGALVILSALFPGSAGAGAAVGYVTELASVT